MPMSLKQGILICWRQATWRRREKKEEGARGKMRRGRKKGQEEEGKGEEAGVGEGEWLVCKLPQCHVGDRVSKSGKQ